MGTRMQLESREMLVRRMDRKGFSNRRLARYAECAPATIDNLVNGVTRSVNKPRTAELICEALDVDLEFLFVPTKTSTGGQRDHRHGARRVMASTHRSAA